MTTVRCARPWGMADAQDLLWTKLRELDSPTHLERPADFDEAEAAARFVILVNLVDAAFGCECSTDAGPALIQDASFYGDLRVPAAATYTGHELWIRVSNFGPMATFSSGPGDAADMADIARSDRDRIENALTSAGYLLVPKAALRNAYDGRANSPFLYTWWSRYFDYL